MMQLAVRSELSLSAVDSLEHGRTIPTVRTADALATALDLDCIDQVDWLEPNAKPPSKAGRYARLKATAQAEPAAGRQPATRRTPARKPKP
jgi:transcriptional regulator with XRE-family HTH domain